MGNAIIFEHIKKKFPKASYPAVDDVSCTIEEGEFVTILGPSGCGKTTLLKMVNRLYEPDEGSIFLFGKDIASQDAVELRRGIGYVIQQVGLFPHMTIQENISVVPELLKWDSSTIKKRVNELLQLVELDPDEFANRYPSQLSGGQQQRIGLARALAAEPSVMLLDEPFGAIDAITRLALQDELLRLHKELKKTFLLVTHDINEAFKLGQRVMIMKDGKLLQFDTPKAIVQHPSDPFVESLINSAKAQEQLWESFV